jgi:hypothetical protein
VDVIEYVMGVHERCLAAGIAPPSHVRTWYSNYYTSNGVSITTNIVTNAFGWFVDRQMIIDCDSKLADLIPYFVTESSWTNIYDERPWEWEPFSYEPSMEYTYYSVTGIFAELQIGNGTNQFTRTPCWTNAPVTNYVVTYTNYWPSTTTSGVVVCYTTDQRQAVNYASNYIAGQWKWTTQSNWPSFVTQTVNAATFGELGWQIYPEDMQERYKVLTLLRYTAPGMGGTYHESRQPTGGWTAVHGFSTSSWALAFVDYTNTWASSPLVTNSPDADPGAWVGASGNPTDGYYIEGMRTKWTFIPTIPFPATSTLARIGFYGYILGSEYGNGTPFYDHGDVVEYSTVRLFDSTLGGTSLVLGSLDVPLPYADDEGELAGRGWSSVPPTLFGVEWDFKYCTNKYW